VHVVLLAVSAALIGESPLYAVAFALQLALLAAALLAGALPLRPLLVARYYVWTTASVAAGLWDHLRDGTPAGWEPVKETR
jgi:hypothetical protein